MNKKTAERHFLELILPGIVNVFESGGKPDKPARRQAWNDFTDCLCKDGKITQRQYATWTAPRWLETRRPHSMPRV